MAGVYEHRRSYRLAHPGAAYVAWKHGTRCYAVDNLSLGGALLLGVPAPPVGARVVALLRMRGARALSLCGHVVRASRSELRPEFAVRFDWVPSDAEDEIHDLWLADHERPEAPTVLLVARSAKARRALSEFLQRLGWSVATAGTPLEAIEKLTRLADDLHWIVVFDRLTQTTGASLLSYVGSAHPGLRRLLICPRSARRLDHVALWRGIAEAAILQPINPPDLARAMGARAQR